MSINDFILDLESNDIHLLINKGKLKINAPKGALRDDLIIKIKKNKEEIIKALTLKEDEALLTTVNTPFFQYNVNAKRNIYCFPSLIGFGIWCFPLVCYLGDFKLTSFNFVNKENVPAYYADLIINDAPLSDIIILTYSAGGRLTFEVTKELESRNIKVSDIIMIDVIKTTPKQFATKEDVEAQDVFEILNKYNLVHLKEKVYSVIYDYMNYTRSVLFSGTIKANIHHVIAKPEDRDLAYITQGQYKEYLGMGEHGYMLDLPFLKHNAELINSILLKINPI